MMNWSEYEPESQPIDYRPWWLEVLFCVGSIAIAALIIAMFAGCA